MHALGIQKSLHMAKGVIVRNLIIPMMRVQIKCSVWIKCILCQNTQTRPSWIRTAFKSFEPTSAKVFKVAIFCSNAKMKFEWCAHRTTFSVGYSNDNIARMCILRYLTKTNENLSACAQAHFVVLPTPSEYRIRTPALSMVHHRQTFNIQNTFCHTHWNRTTVLQSIQITLKHCNVSNQCDG